MKLGEKNANKGHFRDPRPPVGANGWLGSVDAAAGRKRTFPGVKKNVPRGQEHSMRRNEEKSMVRSDPCGGMRNHAAGWVG